MNKKVTIRIVKIKCKKCRTVFKAETDLSIIRCPNCRGKINLDKE